MSDAPLPPAPALPGEFWRPAAAALLGLMLMAALVAFWRGPVVLVGGGLLATGVGLGAVLARRQVRTELAALLAGALAQVGQPRLALLPSVPALPAPPLLQPLADGLSQLLMRQQMLFDVQAEQLESLRLQAHSDPLTRLPNRRFFMASLDAFLAGDGALAEAGLLLLRVCDLQGMNRRIGHAATDNVLQALAQALRAYPSRIERCCAGRLNGADFALLLPVGGMARETAAALVQALRLPIQRIDPLARVVAGGVELSAPINANQALAQADAALARSETGGGEAEPAPGPALDGADASLPQGESSWQRRIARALVQGRVALGDFPVRTADGRQLHLDCPLRVQLVPNGPLEPAARWLSLATRSRLCAAVDEKALALALKAIARDGVARCINIAGQSVASAEFVAAVSRRLESEPALACRLWIDLPESLALERPLLVREVSRRWRPLGVMLGLEHAGEGLARIPRLIDLGFDCVRIDSRYVNGVAADAADAARRYLQGLVKLVQTVGLQVTAEGVRSADDLDMLWRLGFDAATGPAVVAEPALAA